MIEPCPRLVRLEARIITLALTFASFAVILVAPDAAADDRAAAKTHYEAATRFYDIHEYAAALKEYKAGYLVKPDPSFLYNIGQCYKKLDQPQQAREFFREYLKKAAPGDPRRALAEARLRELDLTEPEAPTSPPPVSNGPWGAPSDQPKKSGPVPAAAILPEQAQQQAAGVELSTDSPPREEAAHQPYYRTWWFWTVVGAAVVAGTVTAVVLAGSDNQLNVGGTTLGSRKVLQ
jgi:tetratricopeptide (TPR) repeat protein